MIERKDLIYESHSNEDFTFYTLWVRELYHLLLMHEIWEFGNKNIQKGMNGNSYANILYYYRMGQSPAQVFLTSPHGTIYE